MFNSSNKEKINEGLATIGLAILQIGGLIVFIMAIIYMFQGKLVEKAASFLLILNSINSFVFYLLIFIILPLAIFRKTRPFSGIVMFLSSYFFGLGLWIYSAIVTYLFWGWIALFVGIFMAGVGVLPVAMLASIFNGEWALLVNLVFGLVLTLGSRFLGMHLIYKAGQEESTVKASSINYGSDENIDEELISDAVIINDENELAVNFCKKCGKEVVNDANFCRSCGNKLN